MSIEPFPCFPHNTLWRRLRRRYFFDRFSLVGLVFACPPALCSVSWLLHGPLWLTVGCGALWFLTSLFMALMMTMSLVSEMRRGVRRAPPFPSRLSLLWSLFVYGTTMVALLMGRVDGAFYMAFGLGALSGLSKSRPRSLHTALNLVLALALCLAFATHALGMVVALFLLQMLGSWGLRPALREAIRRLPTRAEYVARSREACAAGGG